MSTENNDTSDNLPTSETIENFYTQMYNAYTYALSVSTESISKITVSDEVLFEHLNKIDEDALSHIVKI